MALFTDSAAITIDDLLLYETSLVSVASSHGINVDTKIALAMGAIGDKLMQWLLAIGASDPQWLTRRTIGLSTVIITPTLRRWITFDALSRFFAEAYNVQLNTRFQGKWTEYQGQASDAEAMTFASGLSIVSAPLPQPAMPVISVQDGSMPAQAIFVQTAWVDALGTESAVSPVNGEILSGAAEVAVAMAEGAIGAPAAAIGWNVYTSALQTGLTRQNQQSLPIGSAWQVPASGLIQGPPPTGGQGPSWYVTLTRRILRG
ncbi:MAG: hypothetical protein JO061_23075 [Acidobacteriaceae bacterium]|nr:hypothetical protein [Acidobacteriaceae bacterium]